MVRKWCVDMGLESWKNRMKVDHENRRSFLVLPFAPIRSTADLLCVVLVAFFVLFFVCFFVCLFFPGSKDQIFSAGLGLEWG